MVTYVLDSSAVLRYFDDEAGGERVAEIIKCHLQGTCQAVIAAPHWGEIAGIVCKKHGRRGMNLALSRLTAFGMEPIPADGNQSVEAALISLGRHIPYVDAFGVSVATESPDRVLVTADFDLRPAQRDVKIEFLPTK